MRLFQNLGISDRYTQRLKRLTRGLSSFDELLTELLKDRYGASHLLKPALDREASAFLTSGNDIPLQRAWAREHGLRASATMEEVLLAQVEAHQPDVFYNLDPLRFDSTFVRKLPSCVKKSICWRAAPSPGANFGAYDLVVCNFPGIIESWRQRGLRSAYFAPAHDPVMDEYADSSERAVDVVFVGTFSRHHSRRAQILEAVAGLASEYRVVMSLDRSRLTRLAESPVGLLPGLRSQRRPPAVRRVASEPTYGLDLYRLLSASKIVLNGAIDMSGDDRGNMRCFESMGCGALLVSDRGRYPDGMVDGRTMLTYGSAQDVSHVLRSALSAWEHAAAIARAGLAMVRSEYSKNLQWQRFQDLV
ncbi:MAG: glycosyltransferase protein [Gemmatimonadetes bacterium]|nr:glycosyltransferase protein [Gemmatimonadota bacterium]